MLHQVGFVDIGIIILYLIMMIIVGVHFAKRVKSPKDYYVAGHTLGPFVLMATVCATIAGGGGLMGRAGVAYSAGFKAVMTAIPYLIGLFVFSGVSGRISAIGLKYGITSIPDLFRKRFGKRTGVLLGFLIAFAMMGTLAAQVTATATILKLLIGTRMEISYEFCAVIASLVFMVYTATSGLFGVVYTDVLQFFILVSCCYIMIPIGSLVEVGGVSAFLANLDVSKVVPYIDGAILGDIVTYLVFTMAGAEMWQRAFAAKDPKSAKRGNFMGVACYTVMIGLVFAIGLLGYQILGEGVEEAYGSLDAVVPLLAIKVLPTGLLGLSLAGMLATIMSTADSYLLVSVQSCVHDIGRPLLPKLTDKQELLMDRVFTVLMSVLALLLALCFKNAYNVVVFSWGFYAAAAGIPAFAALFWRKATTAGIVAGMLGGLVVSVVWYVLGEPFGLGSTVPGTIVCLLLLVTVCLATYQKHPTEFLGVKKNGSAYE